MKQRLERNRVIWNSSMIYIHMWWKQTNSNPGKGTFFLSKCQHKTAFGFQFIYILWVSIFLIIPPKLYFQTLQSNCQVIHRRYGTQRRASVPKSPCASTETADQVTVSFLKVFTFWWNWLDSRDTWNLPPVFSSYLNLKGEESKSAKKKNVE